MSLPARSLTSIQTSEDLLLRVALGDRAAFTALYDSTVRHTLGIVQRVLVDPSQSEEVTQDVYLEVWQTATRFDPARGRARSWILVIAHRTAVDRVRASQASRNRDHAAGVRDGVTPFDHVSEAVETSLEYDRARRALSRLTVKQRTVIELTHDQHLTHSQIATRLGVNSGTIKTRLRDGLIALRREMDAAA